MPRISARSVRGVDFKDRQTGDYTGCARSACRHLPYQFRRTDFKKHLGERGAQGSHGAMRTMVVQLLVKDNALRAIAFNFRTGEWTVIRAKAVVLAAGDVNRISKMLRPRLRFLAHSVQHRRSQAMDTAPAPRWPTWSRSSDAERPRVLLPGLNALGSLGAYFVNKAASGSCSSTTRRARIPSCSDRRRGHQRIPAGNGPIYLDCRHLSQTCSTAWNTRCSRPLHVAGLLPAEGVNFRETGRGLRIRTEHPAQRVYSAAAVWL